MYDKQLSELNDFMDELLDELDDYTNQKSELTFWLAGGAVTSVFTKTPINDYDLYFKNEEDLNLFKKAVSNIATLCQETDRAITMNHSGTTFQLIKLYVNSAEQIFENFDYTINMGAVEYEINPNNPTTECRFILHPDFMTDLASRSLIFNPKTLYPVNSLFRLKKYRGKGFDINNFELLKLALTINKLEIKTIKDIKNQLVGTSSESATEILDVLNKHEEDKTIDDPVDFLLELIERTR